MVHTRSGRAVIHAESSYGRAASQESKRRMRKRKLGLSQQQDGVMSLTPRRTTRAQIQEAIELATPPSAHRVAAAPRTPSPTRNRRLRGRLPRCSDFGPSRHFTFRGQGFLLCSACDLWDARLPDSYSRMSGGSRRFACKAGHTSFSHPTSSLRRRSSTTPLKSNRVAREQNLSIASSSDAEEVHYTSNDEEDHSTTTSCSDNERGDPCQHSACSVGGTTTTDTISTTTTTITAAAHTNGSGGSGTHTIEAQNTDSTALQQLLREKEQKIEQLKGKVVLLKEKLQDMVRKNKVLEEATRKPESFDTTSMSPNEVFQNQVLESIKDVLRRYPRWSSKRTGSLVVQALWDQEANLPELLKLSRKHFRNEVFTPFNVLREMDLAGGTLSYEGIDVLRRVETAGLKRFRGSMIPSKSELKRVASMVEWFARPYCPFVLTETTKGESVEFDYAKAMLCITQAFHLDEVGKMRSLSVASSIDGASLTKNLSIIAGGIKIIDRGARCPLTRQPLLDNPTRMKAQSRNLCIPLKIMMGRETKETFVEFATLFSFLDNLAAIETIPPELTGFMPFNCMTNCDLSAQWKGLCKGGAAKVHRLPCTGCATESKDLATPNVDLCGRWCHEQSLVDPDWQCFHKEMASPERVSSIKTEVAELLSVLGRALEEIKANSKMACDDVDVEEPVVTSTTSEVSIHFVPQNALEMRDFSNLLTNELMLRKLVTGGSIETRRESLRNALIGEATIVRLTKEILHGDVREGAYFLLMNTLPCILHMENRNGIKLLTMILIEGLANAKSGLQLYVNIGAEGTRVSKFVTDVESIVNTSILGSADDPCQWMCPFDRKKKELGPITMDNVRTRRVVDSLDVRVDLCVTDPARASLWTAALNNYRIAMVLLRKREDFTNAEIAAFQSHVDKFFQPWVQLWQVEGITNYIHMMGAGHIAEYLYKWRNLYRYSQQGWEAMNSLVKTFFFRRTNHGGGVRGYSKKSKLIPIARWLQRRLIFLCRATEESIRQYSETNPMPKGYRTQMLLDNDIYE